MPRRVRALFAVLAVVGALLVTAMPIEAAPVRFGSKLTIDTQPQPAEFCDEPNDTPPHINCTWVMNEAFGRPNGGNKAPKNGTIRKVRLESCKPGSLQVQVARRIPGTAKYKVVRNGPTVDYVGDPEQCGDDDDGIYPIESFNANFHVDKGDIVAIKGKQTGTLRCGSGGDNTLLFSPPLAPGGSARKRTDTQGCWLLVEFQYGAS